MTQKKEKKKGIDIEKVSDGLPADEWEKAYAQLQLKFDSVKKEFENALLLIEETLLRVRKIIKR